ncbi:hypothetical protein AAC978_15230 [Desulfitobacterium sp. THU1]|uniref:hypothetical protein n=1 Tax=Desulfitobacterium sp. THU1 TaxID=3138072 RepID=UPI00311ECFC9
MCIPSFLNWQLSSDIVNDIVSGIVSDVSVTFPLCFCDIANAIFFVNEEIGKV